MVSIIWPSGTTLNYSIGICYKNSNNSSEECDSNGYYKPRYCRAVTTNNIRRIVCVCVIPSNGTRLTDTRTSFEDTGDEDENENMKPRCSGRGIEITL